MSRLFLRAKVACMLGMLVMPARAATIMLREVSSHRGSVVYLGDVADISAATASEREDLVTTPLIAAPAPGTQQFLQARQVRDLLAGRGISVSDLTIAGARTVEVGRPIETANLLALEPIPVLTPVQSEDAVVTAIKQHLINSTGHEDWEIEMDLNADVLRNLAKLGAELEATAGRAPWTGTQRFQIGGIGPATPVSLLARVDRLSKVVVALRKIDQGNLIGEADVEVRRQGGNLSASAYSSLDHVIGKEALRTIDANAVLQRNHVRVPLQVQRGETVKVFARTGGVTVSSFVVVQQDGALGDLVQVQTIDKKDRFAARVSGWRQLEVLPSGAAAVDYSASNRLETKNH